MHLTLELETEIFFWVCFINFEMYYFYLLKDHSGAYQE